MKILWVNEQADYIGGCENYIARTVKLLNEKKIESFLLYSVHGETNTKYLSNFEGAFPVVKPLRQMREINPDIIYVHKFRNTQLLKEIINSDLPVVIFYHDHFLFCLREHKYKTISHATCTKPVGLRCYPCLGFLNRKSNGVKIRTHFSLIAQQNIHKRASAFVVASQYMKEHLKKHDYDANKINTIPLFYEAKEKTQKFNEQSNLILFVGQILRGKGIGVLLKSIKKLNPEISCILCGDGHQKAKYQKMAERLKISHRVKFVGKVDPNKLQDYFSKAEMLIIPSITPETFGLVGLEAMNFAKPVIASDVGGISQWLQDKKNGLLVKPGDVVQLTKAITKLHKDVFGRKKMGQNGRQILQEKFTPQQHIEKLLTLFQNLVEF
ncbi:MAG: glycosyltransferase family 4 protein [Candidatus Cloacimonadota bacterium]|nr:glycosyltransferase family 4 protein [Candidatus Cloacimonadota bacterium]